MKLYRKILQGKTVLITGGTGTWGQEIARQLLTKKVGKIIIFSRNESKQVEMKQKYSSKADRIKYIIGDIRDSRSIDEACKGVNIVFHTAALKHVTKCEQQPREALNTNVMGTTNVINACVSNKVDICVNISSDKACDSSCFYGHTKAISEALITEANNITTHTDFYSVRSGNIFASSGSVIPLWMEQIKKDNKILITDPIMSRFFITINKAVKLTLKTIGISDRGEVFALRMPSFFIEDLAREFIIRFSDKKTEIEVIGRFEGEKEAEMLFNGFEARRMTKTKDYFIIYPTITVDTAIYPVVKKYKKYVDGLSSDDDDCIGFEGELAKMFDIILP